MAVPHNLRLTQPPERDPVPEDPGETIVVNEDEEASVSDDRAVVIEADDGGVVVQFDPPKRKGGSSGDHDANLADYLDDTELGRIGDELLRGIEADDASRSDWLETRANGIDLLALKVEKQGPAATDGTAGESVSKTRHPLLLEAVLQFQANATAELLPAAGPVKVRNDSIDEQEEADAAGAPDPEDQEMRDKDLIAEALEKDFNHYLTSTAREYYPDTDRMLLYVGFGGCAFKKVYRCPIRRRPVSESVDAKDLIVSNAATDMANAGRVTHRIMMRPSTLKRMQLVGAYRDIALSTPQPNSDAVTDKIAETQGVAARPQQPEDIDYTIYETYCELDIKGFEHEIDGEATGLEVPYVVVLEKDSRRVLAIRRNWEEDDELCIGKIPFVKYPFVPGLGFYDIGLVHILGNTTNALTALWRLMIDAGMFGNFPGFLFLKSALRQTTNMFRVEPGGGAPIESAVDDIRKAVMPLPYKEAGPGIAALAKEIAETGQRVGGTASLPVGEGRQDAPVGTTIALIEQATKVVAAVHKRLHAAQAEEFALLKELFRDDPAPLFANARKSRLAKLLGFGKGVIDEVATANQEQANQKVLAALEDNDIVPAADPNTPSHMHRVMKAVAVKQLQQVNPQLYDARKVDERILKMIGVSDPMSLFAPPPPPAAPAAPSPDAQLKAETDLKKTAMQDKTKEHIADLDREADLKKAVLDLAQTLAIHPEQGTMANEFIDAPHKPRII